MYNLLNKSIGGIREMNKEQIEYIKKWLEGASDKEINLAYLFIKNMKS